MDISLRKVVGAGDDWQPDGMVDFVYGRCCKDDTREADRTEVEQIENKDDKSNCINLLDKLPYHKHNTTYVLKFRLYDLTFRVEYLQGENKNTAHQKTNTKETKEKGK